MARSRPIPLFLLGKPQRQSRPFFTLLHNRLDQEGEVTLGNLVDRAEEQTYGLLILLTALPSLIPGLNLGAAPVGGLFIMWLGLQMAAGRTNPGIPQRLREQRIHKGKVKEALAKLEGFLDRITRKPGLRRPLNQRWMGFVTGLTGFLLALPVPLPFGNQLPAAILVLIGTALLEERPSWGWVGAAAAVGNAVYFAMSFDLIVRASTKALIALRHWIA